ncbi:MAG: hypothetical protein QM564_06045 [Bergeyella sp.]
MKTNIKRNLFTGLFAISLITVSCVPDRVDGDGNGLEYSGTADASFSVTETSSYNFLFKANKNDYVAHRWSFDGDDFSIGSDEKKVYMPDAGDYVMIHQVIGQGGVILAQDSKTINVATSDPNSGNLVQGGKFANSDDWSKWTINVTNTSGAQWTFTPGFATLTATGWAGQGIYQPIQVVEGKKYYIDMNVSSTSGCVDTWFEVYVGYNAPVQGQDYNGDGTKYREISTWAGQGTSAFSGKISEVGSGTGIFTATQTGTVYLGIRGGGSDMKNGISITKVEFRGMN